MNLLEDIQSTATDSSSNVETLLRKCKILAARLQNQQLEKWIIWESNGYPEDVPVPSYRVWPLEVKGHFMGPFNSGLKHAPIPTALLPENIRQSYNEYECRQSIAAVESTIEGHERGMLQVSTGNLALTLGTNVYQNMNCLQCWAEFGIGNLIELLNAVQNRVLDFSLALWKENPVAGESNLSTRESISQEKVTQLVNQTFNTTVHSGAANVLGTANDSFVEFNIESNNFDSVHRVLKSNGVSEEDIAELKKTLDEDDQPQSRNQFGPKVASWISGMMKKAAEGTWNIGIAAAGNLLSKTLSQYYGI